MPGWLEANWQFLAGVLVAVWTVWSYLMNRRDEAAWRRTEFMVEQLRVLDTDGAATEALAILEGWRPDLSVEQIFADPPQMTADIRGVHVARFDRLLNLLWCVAYAHLELKTITWKELAGFGWYIWRVASDPAMAKYCESHYPEVLDAAKVLQKKGRWDAALVRRSR
jgi:hypothetical protein